MHVRSIFLAAIAAISLSPAAYAGEVSTSHDKGGIYLDTSVAPAYFSLHVSNAAVAAYAPQDYFGVTGNVGLCVAGVGAQWLDLCGGATGFVANGDRTVWTTKTTADMQSLGGYVQAKAHVDNFTIAPFVGYRAVSFDAVSKWPGNSLTTKVPATDTLFGGADLGWKFNNNIELGIRGEYGQSTSSTYGFNYTSAAAYLRVRF